MQSEFDKYAKSQGLPEGYEDWRNARDCWEAATSPHVIRQRLTQMLLECQKYLEENGGKKDCMGAMQGELDCLVALKMLEENEMTFEDAISTLIDSKARSKGYSEGPGKPNEALQFVKKHLAGTYQHPLGEVLYKIIRFSRLGNREDLAKAAAWLKLVYDDATAEGGNQ